ncbi:MAG: hypothetical protein ACR2NM_08660, partial [Bythopirellula sp.]
AALRSHQNLAFLAGLNILPFTPPTGDFDSDGDSDRDRDGIDYLRWQLALASDPPSLSQLAAWQADYGQGNSRFVARFGQRPEPRSLSLVWLVFASIAVVRNGCFAPSAGERIQALSEVF